ncbi:MAG: hypothetical protein QHH00_01885 [Methanomassiliicoccales archaeon]|jgi:hypothetical protein|nr:hypothetical protein [Methanomassiliicoccales archaeon]
MTPAEIAKDREDVKKKDITLISSVQTTWSRRKVLDVLESIDWKSIFLPLPRAWEDAIAALREGFEFQYVIEEMESSGIIHLPEDRQIVASWEPLIKGISHAPPERKVRCYRDIASFDSERQIAMEYVILALRARSGRIEISKWKELLCEEIDLARKESESDARRLKSELTGHSVCVDSSGDLEEMLRSEGIEVKRVIVDSPVLPLDVLRSEMRWHMKQGREMPDDAISMRIKEHLEFLDLLIKSRTFDDAYAEWKTIYRRQN